MFFLLRSACCIGLVVAALPEGGDASRLPRAPAVAAAGLSGLQDLCAAMPERCRDLLSSGLRQGAFEASLALVRAPHGPSVDNLMPSDRRPAGATAVRSATAG